jgi:hypothetical protein
MKKSGGHPMAAASRSESKNPSLPARVASVSAYSAKPIMSRRASFEKTQNDRGRRRPGKSPRGTRSSRRPHRSHFDFLTVTAAAREREVENGLLSHLLTVPRSKESKTMRSWPYCWAAPCGGRNWPPWILRSIQMREGRWSWPICATIDASATLDCALMETVFHDAPFVAV